MTEIRTTSRPAESGHWYSAQGRLVETVAGAKGQDVRPDIRHARKLDLAPGVTTIIKLQDREALTQWRERQTMLAALTLPRLDGESDDSFVTRVLADAKQQAIDAAAKGTEIHARIEREINNDTTDAWVLAARHKLWEICGPVPEWRCEQPAVSPYGFATKSDLHYVDEQHHIDDWVVDVKTKEGDVSDARVFDDHALQLAATRHALGLDRGWSHHRLPARCGILFVSRTQPQAAFVTIDEAALDRGWRMFRCLLRLWQEKTGYRPTWAREVTL